MCSEWKAKNGENEKILRVKHEEQIVLKVRKHSNSLFRH